MEKHMKNVIPIEDYQLKELNDKKLFINKYDTSLKYDYELNIYWKEFLFDLLQEMATRDMVYLEKQDNLLEYLKEDYQTIIKCFNLKIDIKDYIELNDYISFDEWLKIEGNSYGFYENKIVLITDLVIDDINVMSKC